MHSSFGTVNFKIWSNTRSFVASSVIMLLIYPERSLTAFLQQAFFKNLIKPIFKLIGNYDVILDITNTKYVLSS